MNLSYDPGDRAVADALILARRGGQAADADGVTVRDVAQAYRVQDLVAQAMGWNDGTPPRHWKSGGPGREATLTHAPLPSIGVWTSPADARHWPFYWRGIEVEIALRLDQAVDGDPLCQEPRRFCGFFRGKLEETGAIEWRDAWTITELGRSVLASGLFAAASPSER